MFRLMLPVYSRDGVQFETATGIFADSPAEALKIAKKAGHFSPIIAPMPEDEFGQRELTNRALYRWDKSVRGSAGGRAVLQ